MVALYQISANTVLHEYGAAPPYLIQIPNICDVHAPELTWSFGDYKLIPTVYVGTPPDALAFVNNVTYSVATVNGTLSYVITTFYTHPTLSDYQADLCTKIDNRAEEIRIKYLTPGAGLATVFHIRYQEALAMQGDASPNNTTYPIHAAIVAAGAANLTVAATLTLNNYHSIANTAGAIEQIRLTTKNNINSANTLLHAFQAYANADWSAL